MGIELEMAEEMIDRELKLICQHIEVFSTSNSIKELYFEAYIVILLASLQSSTR